MKDMLVKLYDLPEIIEYDEKFIQSGIDIRRAKAAENHIIVNWIKKHFNKSWASECEASFANHPISCFIALQNGELKGFSCYDASCMDILGPIAVHDSLRGVGAGKYLLLRSLLAMKENGHIYAIIGGVGPEEFYKKIVNAQVISGSEHGFYQDVLTEKEQ